MHSEANVAGATYFFGAIVVVVELEVCVVVLNDLARALWASCTCFFAAFSSA
jgi:hypothetical protein